MENPNFEASSSAFKLPNLGTTKKASVKSIEDIVAKPTVVNLENAERGQVFDKKKKPVLKKHIMAKKWIKLEIGMTAVNFVVILCFFIASMIGMYYISNNSDIKQLTDAYKEWKPKIEEAFEKHNLTEKIEPFMEKLPKILDKMIRIGEAMTS